MKKKKKKISVNLVAIWIAKGRLLAKRANAYNIAHELLNEYHRGRTDGRAERLR